MLLHLHLLQTMQKRQVFLKCVYCIHKKCLTKLNNNNNNKLPLPLITVMLLIIHLLKPTENECFIPKKVNMVFFFKSFSRLLFNFFFLYLCWTNLGVYIYLTTLWLVVTQLEQIKVFFSVYDNYCKYNQISVERKCSSRFCFLRITTICCTFIAHECDFKKR